MSNDTNCDGKNSNNPIELNEPRMRHEYSDFSLFNLNAEISLLEIDLSAYHNRMEHFKQQQQETKNVLCAQINESRYQSEIRALQEVNQQLIFERAEQSVKCREQEENQTKLSNEMETILAEKTQFAQQFEAFKEQQEQKLDELQEMLQQSQFEFITSVNSMQTCIDDLKYEANHMSHPFVQSTESLGELKKEDSTSFVYGAKTSDKSST